MLSTICLSRASDSIDPMLGGVVLQIVAAILGALSLAARQLIMASSTAAVPLLCSQPGVLWAIAAGVAVAIAEILSFVISSMGVPASKSIPTIVGGSVLIGTLLGTVWLGERLTLRGWSGIVMIAVGIALVGTDQGGAPSLH